MPSVYGFLRIALKHYVRNGLKAGVVEAALTLRICSTASRVA
jgi:hypothetical protein